MATRKGRVGPSSFEAAAADVAAAGALVVARDEAPVDDDAAPGTHAFSYASFPRGWLMW